MLPAFQSRRRWEKHSQRGSSTANRPSTSRRCLACASKTNRGPRLNCSGKRLGNIVTFTARFDLLDLEVMVKRGCGGWQNGWSSRGNAATISAGDCGTGFVPDDRLLAEGFDGFFYRFSSTAHKRFPLGVFEVIPKAFVERLRSSVPSPKSLGFRCRSVGCF
jgi:hypothetical protein